MIPRESAFTTVDLMASLEALDPRGSWRKRSIENHLSRLKERGLIKRLQHETRKGKMPAQAAGLTDRRWSVREMLAAVVA